MKKLLLPVLLIIGSVAYSQTCSEYLQGAQSLFDEGKIHELLDERDDTWGTCLDDVRTTFSKEEKVQAFRLLTLTYLQLDEPAKADEYIERLFDADPEFEPNPSVDPTEFINLYYTYRTKPLFRIGVRGGPNTAMAYNLERIGTTSDPQIPNTIPPTLGLQIGASVEIDMLKYKRESRFYEKIILNPEIFYTRKLLVEDSETDWKTSKLTGTMTSLDFHALAHWDQFGKLLRKGEKAGEKRKFLTRFTFGPAFEYRLGHTDFVDNQVEVAEEKDESRNLNHINNFNRFDLGIIVGVGLRYKVGLPVITMDVRYRYNFIPIVSNPYASPSNIITFGSDPPDQKILSLPTVNVGVHFPIYKHEKLLDQ